MGAQQSNGSGTGRPDSGIGLDFRGASSPTLKRAFPAPPIGYTPSGDAVLERLSRGTISAPLSRSQKYRIPRARAAAVDPAFAFLQSCSPHLTLLRSAGPDGRFRLRSEEDSPQKFTVQCVPVQNPLRFLGDMDSPRSTYDFSNSIKGLPPTTNSPFIPSVCTDSEDSDDAEVNFFPATFFPQKRLIAKVHGLACRDLRLPAGPNRAHYDTVAALRVGTCAYLLPKSRPL